MFNVLFAILILLGSVIAFPDEKDDFTIWLETIKAEARAEKISERTVKNTFKNATYLPNVIVLDRSQPEFVSTFFAYMNKRVTESRINEGRQKRFEYAQLLTKLEQQYGVPNNIIIAFWGLETNYGRYKGNYALPSALMTLAYEGRRADFFRSELMDLMRIADAGHSSIEGMRGSWAGAMGHMQFMPSTFVTYAVDGDGDGRHDIWNSLPDAFSSAANYLSRMGWKTGEPVALEVQLPPQFDYFQAQLSLRKGSTEWMNLGVTKADGTPLPNIDNAAILLPQGWQGPAFLVASNFDVIMKWNRSINYALSVSHLADQLEQDQPIVNGWAAAEYPGISFNQAWAMQAKLNILGFDSGEPDGFPGTKTQQAIRNYQLQRNMPADGYPSHALFNQLMKEPTEQIK
jgi:membrane-bound lytic murein transglycosylase B